MSEIEESLKKENEGEIPVGVTSREIRVKKLKVKSSDSITISTTNSGDSEYETLEEDNGDSLTSTCSRSRRSSFSQDEDKLSEDLVMKDEREDGDGQEESSVSKDKKLDDDEDRRNPQYIPKKGTFYEHDDRTVMDENENKNADYKESIQRDASEMVEKEQKLIKKGKVWTEKADQWSHDLYKEDEQMPKSKQELIETYGYDIRNEEAPPKARRRRRYGRGPNKYTRNWEDEDAYMRAPPTQRRVFHNNREEFPDLPDSTNNQGHKRKDNAADAERASLPGKKTQPPVPSQTPLRDRFIRRDKDSSGSRGEMTRNEDIPLRDSPAVGKESPAPSQQEKPINRFPSTPLNNNQPPKLSTCNDKTEKEVQQPRVGRGRGFRGTGKPRPTMEFVASQGRTAPFAFGKGLIEHDEDRLQHAADMLIGDFNHLFVSGKSNHNITNIVEETIIPRSERPNHQGGGETVGGGGRAKRYSTQRQRSLPETTPPPTYSPPHSIPYYTQPPPTSYVPTPVYNEVAPPSVTSPPIQMVAFLPPGPPPTAATAPPYPPPPLLNYIPPPTYPPLALQPPISGQFDDLTTTAELYQGQSGITYYSTQTQSVVPRPNPPRRVKLAIPIVPPPDKGGAKQQSEVQSATLS